MAFKLPTDTERHAIFGMTGSGKTQFAVWMLSLRNFHRQPWIIVDFKHDPLFGEIAGIREITLADRIPKRPGIYVIRPMPADKDDGKITAWLYKVWEREHVGLFIDEGYMIGQHDPGLRTVLTQGRSKRIPMIVLSQRPAWVSPFVLSETEVKSVFFLQMAPDIKRVREWIPDCDPYHLPPFHSVWWNMPRRELANFGPCPPEAEILDRFDYRRVKRFPL